MSPQSTLFNTQGVIIGACLIETNAFHRINGILKPDYFTTMLKFLEGDLMRLTTN